MAPRPTRACDHALTRRMPRERLAMHIDLSSHSTASPRRSTARLGLLVLLGLQAATGACSDEGDGLDRESAGETAPPYSCYYEARASYSCADGDGDPGVWEAICGESTEEQCLTGIVGTSDYIDGCLFLTEFRSIAWLPADECSMAAEPNSSEGGGGNTGDTSSNETESGPGGGGVGAACGADSDCDSGLGCVTGMPGGYCTTTCESHADCPGDALCWELVGVSELVCLDSCSQNSDCRTGDGYVCDADNTCFPS